MTHYETNYKDLSWDEKCAKAVKDCEEYLGSKAHFFPGTVRECRTMGELRLILSFVGIQYFPVTALAYAYAPELLEV